MARRELFKFCRLGGVWRTCCQCQQQIAKVMQDLYKGMIFLSGWAFNLPANEIIEIRCATYKGLAYYPRMTATLIDPV